jgi:penicillin-binding protein 2
MVSTPSFDPNLFSNRLSVRDWQRMNEHPRTPLLNRAISGLYPPGSTFKMVVLAAALEAGVISKKTRIDCSGAFEFGGQNFHCWLERGHGLVNAEQSIERSCDVYFYQIALKTGINRIHDMARRLGLGDVSALGLISEKEGIIPNRDWKLEKRGVVWTPGETVVAGIGQGFVLTTPLQLALMTARIANGRSAIIPSLVTRQSPERRTEKSAVFPPLDVSPDIIRFLHKSMRKVMAGGLGTARKHDIDQGMAGKTGTVQVKRITKEQREKGIIDNIDRPWKERDHALFVAFAPYEKPRYAISVIVEHGGSGSSAAAPIARDIMDFMLKSDGMSA